METETLLELLDILGGAINVRFRLMGDDENPEELEVIGDPPGNAYAIKGRVVVCSTMQDAADVEEALHEAAHLVVGMDEPACYRLEAVWALAFPTLVSAQVSKMAREADASLAEYLISI